MKRLLSLMLTFAMISAVLPMAGFAAAEDLSIDETIALYTKFDYSDPMWITDEDFFGVWNSENSVWEKEPYLDYDNFPELSRTRDAVMAGDYILARQEVTQYYKEKFQNQPRTPEKLSDKANLIKAKLAAYNSFTLLNNVTLLDIVTFSQDAAAVSADILSVAKAAASDANIKTRTFEICAVSNDAAVAEIASRESDSAPYVEAEVNGVPKRFPVVADTYIRGGDYETDNFGTENAMYVAENDDFTNVTKPYYDENAPKGPDRTNTMRARITVDFGDAIGEIVGDGLVEGDIITSAKLCMTGKVFEGEGEKECVVMYGSALGGSETDDSWTWSEAGRFYVNFGGVDGPFVYADDTSSTTRQPAEFYSVTSLCGAYRYTGDETYAYHAFRIYNNYVRKYGHKIDLFNMLQAGVQSQDLPVILAQLSTSKHFNADNFVPILKHAYLSGDTLIKLWDSQAETTNWGLYETAGLANLAINFKEFKIVSAPLKEGGYGVGGQGGWNECIWKRYRALSENLIRDDDSFKETMGYGKESVNQFLKYVTYKELANEPNDFDEDVKENLKKFGRYMMTATGPDFRDFQIGDSYTQQTSFRSVFKDLGELTGDPVLIWAGSDGKSGTPPNYVSKLWETNRKASLKTGWGDEDVYIDFTSDQSIATHNHPDDLNIVMFAYGQYLLTDQRQYSYGQNAPERIWLYSTQAHNTLAIPTVSHKANISGIYNGPYPTPAGENFYYNREQEASPGTIHRSEINDAYDCVEMSHTNYENYNHPYEASVTANINCRRLLLFLKNAKYAIVTDYVTALDDADYTIWQNWHMLPEAEISMDEKTGIAKSNFTGANIQVIPVLTQSPMNSKLADGYYCPSNGVLNDTKYAVYEKTGAGNKVFNTVLLPTKPGADIRSEAINLPLEDVTEESASAFCITMTDANLNQRREASYYILHDERYAAQRKFGSYSTDGKLAFAEKVENEPSMLILQDGTNISDMSRQKILLKSNEVVEELSVTFDGSALLLDTDKDIDLTKLTIRAENGISSVLLNGEAVSYSQANNYVYFGTEPILADEEAGDGTDGANSSDTATPNTGSHGANSTNTSDGSSGGSGGSSVGGGGGAGSDTQVPTPSISPSDAFSEELRGHWGENEIKELIDKGIVKGDDNGRLNLKNSVTRAELLTMLVRALALTEKPYSGEFADVSENDWYAGALAAAKAAGLVDGSEGKAMPEAKVTREQMAKFLVSAFALTDSSKPESEAISFTDNADISLWAKEFVDKATALGILNGMGDGTFMPKGAVLREQAFTAIGRLIG